MPFFFRRRGDCPLCSLVHFHTKNNQWCWDNYFDLNNLNSMSLCMCLKEVTCTLLILMRIKLKIWKINGMLKVDCVWLMTKSFISNLLQWYPPQSCYCYCVDDLDCQARLQEQGRGTTTRTKKKKKKKYIYIPWFCRTVLNLWIVVCFGICWLRYALNLFETVGVFVKSNNP